MANERAGRDPGCWHTNGPFRERTSRTKLTRWANAANDGAFEGSPPTDAACLLSTPPLDPIKGKAVLVNGGSHDRQAAPRRSGSHPDL